MHLLKFSLLVLCLYSFTIQPFHSAGVVPVFRSRGHGLVQWAFITQTPWKTIQNMGLWQTLLFSDTSATKHGNEDPATTAARGFFDKQTQYRTVEELAQALRRHAQSFDMGNDHVTYFLPIQDRYLKAIQSPAPIDESTIVINATDIGHAITYAQKNLAQTHGRGILVHDQNGNTWTLLDAFIIGLVKNKDALFAMHLHGL